MYKGHKTMHFFSKVVFSALLMTVATATANMTDANAADTVLLPVNLNIPATISITSSPTVNFGSIPAGTFYTDHAEVRVTTNSALGYTLSMAMDGDSTNNALNLSGASKQISSITSNKKRADFSSSEGGWGYSTDASDFTYHQLPTVSGSTHNSVQLKNHPTKATDDLTNVEFGIMAPSGATAGTYSNRVIFTAVSNMNKTVTEIRITGSYKTAYAVGENFNTTGMIVTAYYSDGTSAVVSDYIVTNGNSLSAGQTSVTVAYVFGNTVTKDVTITVTDQSGGNSGGGSTNGLQSAPLRATRPAANTETESDGDNTNYNSDAEAGNAEPQGRLSGYSNLVDGLIGDILLAICVSAVLGMIFFLILALRRKDEDEEEADNNGTPTAE